MKTIDIVLPVYNEEEGIEAFNAALFETLDSLENRYEFQVIYVLDRSRDNTFATLKRLAAASPRITVLHLSRRFGHQMSLVAGIDRCRGDAVIMMDCDLQHPPAVIPLLLERFEEGYDIVHTIRQYTRQTGSLKRATSRIFYRLQNALSPVELREGAADFRLISRKVAAVFQTSIREQSQFLRGLFQWVGFRSTTITFVSPPRFAGVTKYQFEHLMAFAITGILSFSKIPLRLTAVLGVMLSALGVVYGLVVICLYFVAGHILPGYTSLVVAVLFIGGLQLCVLGIIGEYIGSIFDEVKHRPLYVVDEIIHHGTSVAEPGSRFVQSKLV
jgi:glycosyltransferase involved in cell wall biosynthesis